MNILRRRLMLQQHHRTRLNLVALTSSWPLSSLLLLRNQVKSKPFQSCSWRSSGSVTFEGSITRPFAFDSCGKPRLYSARSSFTTNSSNTSSGHDELLRLYEKDLDELVRVDSSKNVGIVASVVAEIGLLPYDNSIHSQRSLLKIFSMTTSFMSINKLNQKEIASFSTLLRKSSHHEELSSTRLFKELKNQVNQSQEKSFSVFTLIDICSHLTYSNLRDFEAKSFIASLSRKSFTEMDKMTGNNLLSLFSILSSKIANETIDNTEIQVFASLLVQVLAACPSRILTPDFIGDIFYNLKDVSITNADDDGNNEIAKLLSVFTKKIEGCRDDSFSMKNVSKILYGMRRMKSENFEVVQLLGKLHAKIESIAKVRSDRSIQGHTIAMSLYGLQGISSTVPIARKIIASLSIIIVENQQSLMLNSQEIGNAFYGLQNMSGDHEEVRRIISTLGSYITKEVKLKPQEISNLLFGLKCCNSYHEEVVSLLPIVEDQIRRCKDANFKSLELGNAIYGMQLMQSSDIRVGNLLRSISDKVRDCNHLFSSQDLAISLFGLKSMSSDSKAVIELISHVTGKLDSCKSEFSNRQLGMALFGLQGLSSEHKEVRKLLKSLESKLDPFYVNNNQSDDRNVRNNKNFMLTSHTVGNVFFGLQKMSSDFTEVRSFISVFTKVLLSSSAKLSLNYQEIANSLYGLNCMNSSYPEVISLIKVLTVLIYGSGNRSSKQLSTLSTTLSAQTISSCIFGLQGLTSDNVDVRGLIAALVAKFKNLAAVDASPQFVSSALYGLQCLNNDNKEVCDLVDLVGANISTFKGMLPFRDVALSVYGLQGMSQSQPGLHKIVGFLARKLEESLPLAPSSYQSKEEGLNPYVNSGHILMSASQILIGLIQLSKCVDASDIQRLLLPVLYLLRETLQNSKAQNATARVPMLEVRKLCAVLQALHLLNFFGLLSRDSKREVCELINEVSDVDWRLLIPADGYETSKLEQSVREMVKKEFSKKEYEVHFNQVLFGFDQDIVLKRHGSPLVACIEVDGPSHRQVKKQRYNSLHDAFLKSAHGIPTYRISYKMVGGDKRVQLLGLFAEVKKALK